MGGYLGTLFSISGSAMGSVMGYVRDVLRVIRVMVWGVLGKFLDTFFFDIRDCYGEC